MFEETDISWCYVISCLHSYFPWYIQFVFVFISSTFICLISTFLKSSVFLNCYILHSLHVHFPCYAQKSLSLYIYQVTARSSVSMVFIEKLRSRCPRASFKMMRQDFMVFRTWIRMFLFYLSFMFLIWVSTYFSCI